MIVRYDNSVAPIGPLYNNGAVDGTSYTSEKALKWPVGGSVVVSIDAVPNGNTFDRLSVTPASAFITSSYDVANRKLTISTSYVTTDTNTINDIQNTLRTLTFRAGGQCNATRNIRIWILRPGMQYVDSPGIGSRVIGLGKYLRTAVGADPSIDTYSWTTTAADILFEPVNFGLQPYFISIMSSQEQNAVRTLNGFANAESFLGGKYDGSNNSNGFWRWVDGPDAGVAFWQGTGFGTDAAAVGVGATGRGNSVAGAFQSWGVGIPFVGSTFNFPDNHNGSATTLSEIFLNVINGIGNTWNDDNTRTLNGFFFKMGGFTSGVREDQNVIQIQVIGGNSLLMANPF